MESLSKELGVLIAAIVLYIGDKLWTRWKDARAKAAKVNNSGIEVIEDVNRRVRHAERKIKDDCKAMRLYVMHFSNGVSTESGLHLLKITIRHELLEGYFVEPISQNFQEVPIPDMFIKPMSSLVRLGQYYLKDKSELDLTHPNDKQLHDWLGAYKPEIKSMLWIPLKKANKIVAVLCLHFPIINAVDAGAIIRIKDMKSEIEGIYSALNK